MKIITLLLVTMLSLNVAISQSWSLDKGHSKIGFTVTHHMISEVDGYFKTFDSKLTSAKDDFSDAVFELKAETTTINSENEMRDKDLRGAGFFDVEKFPSLAFKSTSFKKGEGNKYILVGDLTIKDVTKSIIMEVTIVGPQPHPRTKKPAIGIKALATINRKDFNVGTNLPELMVSNEVQLRVTGEFNKD